VDDQLYIRTRGTVQGPFKPEKLQQLAQRGQFGRLHEVSADGVTWKRASSCPELFPAPAPRVVNSTATTPAPEPVADPVPTPEPKPINPAPTTFRAFDVPFIRENRPVSALIPGWGVCLIVLDYVWAMLSVAAGLRLLFVGLQEDSPLRTIQGALGVIYALVIVGFAYLLKDFFRAQGAMQANRLAPPREAVRANRFFWAFAAVGLMIVAAITTWAVIASPVRDRLSLGSSTRQTADALNVEATR
jgi:hypothetical protein